MDKREIGLKLEGDELVPDPLGMGTTLEDFQYEGTLFIFCVGLSNFVNFSCNYL